MSKKQPRKLQVRRETLRTLAADDLARARGGIMAWRNNCTQRYSGCISISYPPTDACDGGGGGGGGEGGTTANFES